MPVMYSMAAGFVTKRMYILRPLVPSIPIPVLKYLNPLQNVFKQLIKMANGMSAIL